MNAEELLENIIVEEINYKEEYSESTRERDRLSAIVAGGNSKKYLGREFNLSDIDTMNSEQIRKLYCKYEARLGASMTKTLGNTFINLYVMGVSKYLGLNGSLKITNPPQLIEDLEEDPFVHQALTSTCCELYYRFGMYLAPFTALLTTAKHIEKREISLSENENNGLKNE